MIDWDKLRVFYAVAEAGSLTRAGEVLHLSQSAVSRQISSLEDRLDIKLFRRHARGLILTEQGELLFETAKVIAKQLDLTQARIRDSKDEVHGELRVTTTTGFGALFLAPRLGRLFDLHPNLKIDLIMSEDILDLPTREADVAIRMKEPSQVDLIRRRLMNINMCLYATETYLTENGTPKTMNDMKNHRFISQNISERQVSASFKWVKELLESDHKSHLTINNYFGILQATSNNLGIGVLPDYIHSEVDNLVQVLPDHKSRTVPVYLAYPEELRHSQRVAAFRNFVVDEIKSYKRELPTEQ